ncbi:MAG: PspC domain-containing protein, partial [Bacteroidia bacterium]
MNRTITMNLSGIIFHIEEDAYDKLNKYLATIKGYFKDSEGKDEIMSDIESRIAEMLQEKVSKTKQAVLMMDVESVIAVMGKPEDFAGENANTENSSEHTFNENKATYTNGKRRRVFRDPDDKIIGGVCSGISSYFDFDPIWLRAAFAISFFVFGSGLLLYIILCIIIPKAKTTAEKLEMRGEKVDVNNIGKAVNEEFEDFKKRMKNFGEEVGSKENKDRIKTSAHRFFDFLGDVFHNIFHIVGKFFIIFFVFLAIILMVGLLATFFGRNTISFFGTNNFSLYEFNTTFLPSGLPTELIVVTLILLIGVPLLSIIYKGIKHLFGIKEKNKIVKYTANALWLSGVALLLYIV